MCVCICAHVFMGVDIHVHHSALSESVRHKLLTAVACRSVVAANAFPDTLRVLCECLFLDTSGIRLKEAGMTFAAWVHLLDM